MIIRNLELVNFRNHKKNKLTFDEHITLITGKNGAGKTNILEAIYLLSTGKSFRADHDRELVSFETAFARVDGTIIDRNEEKIVLELTIEKSERGENTSIKKVKVNKVAKTIQKFTEYTKAVLFTPEDINLVSGSPGDRRRYLDNVLVQSGLDYKRALSTYTKALRQRNKVLELINELGTGHSQMDYWTDKILEHGTFIQQKREDYFNYLNETVPYHSKEINQSGERFEVVYNQNKISKERLNEYKEKEVYAKSTLVGPHRDDFTVLMDMNEIGSFGSRGQQRSAVLALKLSEIDYFKNKIDVIPVLLLDDIFSELDKQHREAVMKVIDKQQTIITSTEHFDLPFEFQEIRL